MSSCASCQHNAVPLPTPVPLFQIRHGYRARWNAVEFSVEAESGQWTLRVQDSVSLKTLYTAQRGGAQAAQSAGADFAIFRTLGHESKIRPDELARELNWQEYW